MVCKESDFLVPDKCPVCHIIALCLECHFYYSYHFLSIADLAPMSVTPKAERVQLTLEGTMMGQAVIRLVVKAVLSHR